MSITSTYYTHITSTVSKCKSSYMNGKFTLIWECENVYIISTGTATAAKAHALVDPGTNLGIEVGFALFIHVLLLVQKLQN